jgi:hypothetical protein
MKNFLHLIINKTVLPMIVSALVSFITTTYLDDTNRKITLKPYLVANVGLNETRDRFGIVIMNMGKGPAIIEKASISLNGTKYTFKDEAPRDTIVSFLQHLDLYTSCREYLLVNFVPFNGIPISDGRILDFLTVPDPYKLPIVQLRDELLATGVTSEIAIKENLRNYRIGYNNCYNKFIDALSNPQNKIEMELHYKSINGELYGDRGEFHPIKTSKPL